uniref:Kelch domain containing 1 n=1 Tax=Sphenodon punctatus TaxID=8508 RepID=A0A8D0GBD9_SPHPU
IHDNFTYGIMRLLSSIEENEVYLPNDELWIYEIDSGLWTMHLMEGELPTSMSGSCGACINGKLYIFGGFDDKGYSNRLYYVNLRTRNGTYLWQKITNIKGQPPTPRDKLSCWVYKDRWVQRGSMRARPHPSPAAFPQTPPTAQRWVGASRVEKVTVVCTIHCLMK